MISLSGGCYGNYKHRFCHDEGNKENKLRGKTREGRRLSAEKKRNNEGVVCCDVVHLRHFEESRHRVL